MTPTMLDPHDTLSAPEGPRSGRLPAAPLSPQASMGQRLARAAVLRRRRRRRVREVSSGQRAARLAATLWGLVAGGNVVRAAGWMWLFWWADAGQPLNPVLIPLTTGLLLVAGALLTPFRPRAGGAVMLLAAAVTLVVLGTDIGPQMLFLYGVSANVLALVVLLVGPGVLALLSARGPQ